MQPIDLIFAVAGAGALLAAVLPRVVEGRPFSLPLVVMVSGVLLYLLPLRLPAPDPVASRPIVEHATEVCVIISLMGAGLAINRPVGRHRWASTWRLLGLAMPLTIGAVALAAYVLLGWPPAAALLLGAVLSPTDPVLASDVQVGEPSDDETDEDEVRFSLTSEAGLNDGLAFPVVYAAIALAAAGGAVGGGGTGGPGDVWPAGWIPHWVLSDLLYKCTIGLVGGLAVGGLLGRLFFRSGSAPLRLAEHREGFVALAATFLSYGITELLHGYGFIAVFVAACSIRAAERAHGYHGVLHGFIEQIERLFTAWLLLLLGGFVAVGGLGELTWRGAAVGLLLLLVIRPVAGWLAQLRGPAGPRERRVTAFFGIRGIGSLFYLAYALGQADFGVDPSELWAIVAFTVLMSVTMHGFAATPVMARLDRSRDAWRRRHRDRRRVDHGDEGQPGEPEGRAPDRAKPV